MADQTNVPATYSDVPQETCPYCQHSIDCYVEKCPASAHSPSLPHWHHHQQFYIPPRAPPVTIVYRGPTLCQRIGAKFRDAVGGCINKGREAKESCSNYARQVCDSFAHTISDIIDCCCCRLEDVYDDHLVVDPWNPNITWVRKCPPGCQCQCHPNIRAHQQYLHRQRFEPVYQGRLLPGDVEICPHHRPVSGQDFRTPGTTFMTVASHPLQPPSATTAAPQAGRPLNVISTVQPRANEYVGGQRYALGCGVEAQAREGWNEQIESLAGYQPLYVHTTYLPPDVAPDDPRLQNARVVAAHNYVTDHLDFPAQEFCGYIDPRCQTSVVGGRTVTPADTGSQDVHLHARHTSQGTTASTTAGGATSGRPSLLVSAQAAQQAGPVASPSVEPRDESAAAEGTNGSGAADPSPGAPPVDVPSAERHTVWETGRPGDW